MVAEPPKQKTKRRYWDEYTDAAIVEFNSSTDPIVRDRIYETTLHEPFCKLVECIFNTFKFDYIKGSVENIKDDALTFLAAQISKFNPEKGKSFGYASIIVKNYFIALNNNEYRDDNRHVPIVAELNEADDACVSFEVLRAQEAPAFNYADFTNGLALFWQIHTDAIFSLERDRKIARAVTRILIDTPIYERIPMIKGIAKEVNVERHRINRVLTKMKAFLPELKTNYMECGKVECRDYPVATTDYSNVSIPRQKAKFPLLAGSKNHEAKLSDEQVIEMRKKYATGQYTQQELGEMYGVNNSRVSTIVTGKAWKHLLPEEFSISGSFRYRGNSKLDAESVREIRRSRSRGILVKTLAQRYGVSVSAIKAILERRTWQHVL